MIHELATNAVVRTQVAIGDCIPTNDLFTSALEDPFNLLVGGVGGVVIKIGITLVLIILLIRALINIALSKKANDDISAIAVVIVAVVGVILGIVIVRTVFAALNGACAGLL